MTSDAKTLRIYDDQAENYAKITQATAPDPSLVAFLARLSVPSHVLDLGCGPGFSAAFFAAAGHTVDATDAAPKMVALAQDHTGVTARCTSFDQLDACARYDGIWANFSLLHAPRHDMLRHLTSINTALKPNGIFHIGMKTGQGEKRDPLGRIYTYYTEPELKSLLTKTGFEGFECHYGCDPGLDGVMADWITILTRKSRDA